MVTNMFLMRGTQKVIEKKGCRRKRGGGLCGVVIVVETSLQNFDTELLGRQEWRKGGELKGDNVD